MIKIDQYYMITGLIFFILMIYSFIFASEYTDDECIIEAASTDESSSVDTNTTSTDNTTARELYTQNFYRFLQTETTTTTPQTATSLTAIPMAMAFLYVIQLGFCIIMMYFLNYFVKLDPEKFGQLGFTQRCGGKLSKCIPLLMILGSWAALGMIAGQAFLILGGDCKDAIHDVGTKDEIKGAMQEASYDHILVCAIFFFLQHFIGAYIRRHALYEAFFYNPPDVEAPAWRRWLFSNLGP